MRHQARPTMSYILLVHTLLSIVSPIVGVHEDTSHRGHVHVYISSQVPTVGSESESQIGRRGVVSNVTHKINVSIARIFFESIMHKHMVHTYQVKLELLAKYSCYLIFIAVYIHVHITDIQRSILGIRVQWMKQLYSPFQGQYSGMAPSLCLQQIY